MNSDVRDGLVSKQEPIASGTPLADAPRTRVATLEFLGRAIQLQKSCNKLSLRLQHTVLYVPAPTIAADALL